MSSWKEVYRWGKTLGQGKGSLLCLSSFYPPAPEKTHSLCYSSCNDNSKNKWRLRMLLREFLLLLGFGSPRFSFRFLYVCKCWVLSNNKRESRVCSSPWEFDARFQVKFLASMRETVGGTQALSRREGLSRIKDNGSFILLQPSSLNDFFLLLFQLLLLGFREKRMTKAFITALETRMLRVSGFPLSLDDDDRIWCYPLYGWARMHILRFHIFLASLIRNLLNEE